jgi:hypothetical protein
MINVRRVPSSRPFSKLYEIRLDGVARAPDVPLVLRRGLTVRCLENVIGVGDAWTLVRAADKAFADKQMGWVNLLIDDEL